MTKKKNITIDDLAVMVQTGFSEMNDRFEKVEGDITDIKTTLGGVKQRMGGLEKRMDIYVDHERRLAKVEKILKVAV